MGSACSVNSSESAGTAEVESEAPDVTPAVDSTHPAERDVEGSRDSAPPVTTAAAAATGRAAAMRKRLSADPSDFRSTVRRGELELPSTGVQATSSSSVAVLDNTAASANADASVPMTERRETLAVFAAAAAEYQRAMEERWGTTLESTPNHLALKEKGVPASSAAATTTEAQQATQRWSVQLSERGGAGLRSPRRRTTLFTDDGVPFPSSQRSSTSTTTTASSLVSNSSLVRSVQDSFVHAHSPTGSETLPHMPASNRIPHDLPQHASPRPTHSHALPPLPSHSFVGERLTSTTDDGDDEVPSPTM